MEIMPNRMDRGFYMYQREFEDKVLSVLRSGWYVLGKELMSFEEEFASYTNTKYCIGLANGLDAIWIAFRILNIGKDDEVIVQGNTYIGLTEKVHFFKQTLFPASQNSNSATAKFYTKEAGASYPGSLPEIEAQSHIHW